MNARQAIRWLLATAAALALLPAMAQRHMTDFQPQRDGFAFNNTFTNDFIREFDVRTGGLCGGMVYAALDFHRARQPVPRQDYRPAVQTRLHDYLYERQVHSIADNADKWAELGFNPFGARNSEFFRWGLQGFGGGRLQELRARIDRGEPVPLGLWHYDGQRGGDHQVLAIGYELGRYRGDLGAHQGDLKIYVYDPNFHDEIKVLVPDLRLGAFGYADTGQRWLTYFVDGKYRPHAPPVETVARGATQAAPAKPGKPQPQLQMAATQAVMAGMAARVTLPLGPRTRELLLTIGTGADDLRGGSDNVNVIVALRGRPPLRIDNLNRGRHWIGNYAQTIPLRLPGAIPLQDITGLTLETRFGGGIGGDNWNVDHLRVEAVLPEGRHLLYAGSGSPLVRFTGERHTFRAPLSP